MKYEILVPPYPLNYYSWTTNQAEEHLVWFIENMRNRAGYVLHCSIGQDLPETAIPEPNLIGVWAWFLKIAKTVPVPMQEINNMRKLYGQFGESFINKEQFSIETEYIIRDIAMLLSEVFITNHPSIHFDIVLKPRNHFFLNQPVLCGFVDTSGKQPFAEVFQPVHMVSVQAAKIFSNSASNQDLFLLYQKWAKKIPREDYEAMN